MTRLVDPGHPLTWGVRMGLMVGCVAAVLVLGVLLAGLVVGGSIWHSFDGATLVSALVGLPLSWVVLPMIGGRTLLVAIVAIPLINWILVGVLIGFARLFYERLER